MLVAEELEELRALQARAYGRDAALTAADAIRLRELQERRVVRAGEAVETGSAVPGGPPAAQPEESGAGDGGGTAETVPAPDRPDDASEDADTEPEAEADAVSSPASLRSLLRAHWRPFAVAGAVMLLAGIGVGWLASGRAAAAPVTLTAEQQEWQDDLVSGGVYDPGSIRVLAVEEGVVIWTATRDARERICLILSTGEVTMPSCDRTEEVAKTGIYGGITVRGAGDVQRQVGAQMLLTAAGEPAVAVSSYDYDPSGGGITYANAAESRTAERLADDGFEVNSLWVVGYDGDVPVWTGMQLESQSQCLVYDGSTADSPVVCADPETMMEQASSLVLDVVDSETGAVTHLEMDSSRGPSYLVITREGGVAGAGED